MFLWKSNNDDYDDSTNTSYNDENLTAICQELLLRISFSTFYSSQTACLIDVTVLYSL